jgi:hypothetical protein
MVTRRNAMQAQRISRGTTSLILNHEARLSSVFNFIHTLFKPRKSPVRSVRRFRKAPRHVCKSGEQKFSCVYSVQTPIYSISLFHRAFKFTMYNGTTNAIVCNKTLIQMSRIKTLKITPTRFDHQLIIIRSFLILVKITG